MLKQMQKITPLKTIMTQITKLYEDLHEDHQKLQEAFMQISNKYAVLFAENSKLKLTHLQLSEKYRACKGLERDYFR